MPGIEEINTAKTIEDFGAQWTTYRENDGYYASPELFQDILGDLMRSEDVRDKNVADIGSGTGRIVNMLLASGAASVTAIEPSDAFEVLKVNTAKDSAKIHYLKKRGDEIPADAALDYVFSIGVLHHIPEPKKVVDAAYNALKPGGRCLIWLYGYEGNEFYLSIFSPLRKITSRMPDFLLAAFSWILTVILSVYMSACRVIPLPMKTYMLGHIAKLSWKVRYLTIFDQLNPTEARYYKKDAAIALLADSGFKDVRIFHRHGYSWTVIGTKV